MERFIYKHHEIVQNCYLVVSRNYRLFLDSKSFLLIALIVIPSYMIFNFILIFESSIILSIFFLLFIVFSLLIILPPIFSEWKGQNFFKLKSKYFESTSHSKLTLEILEKSVGINEKSIVDDLSFEKVEIIYRTLNNINFLDSSCEIDIKSKPEDCYFTSENFFKTLNDLKKTGVSSSFIYLTCMQKEAGFLINDLLKPLLGIETKYLCNYFYYYKGKEFRKIQYNSINAEKKRQKISAINNIFSKVLY